MQPVIKADAASLHRQPCAPGQGDDGLGARVTHAVALQLPTVVHERVAVVRVEHAELT